MKLKAYAETNGQTYSAAYRQFHRGEIVGAYQMDSGTIIVPEDQEEVVVRGTPEQIGSLQNWCVTQNMTFTTGTINCLTLGEK